MLSFGFYNSKGGDRKYDAEQIGAMFNGLITDGVFANYKEALRVTSGAGKREIVVRPGRAWFNGTWTEVDDGGHSIHLGTSFAVDDTFYICLAVSKKSRLNSIAYYKDIPENNPDTGLYYYLLAQINIPAGSDRIMDSMITDTRGSDLCPYVTGIMETVSFEELVKQVCGDSWQDWLGVYEAGITTGVQNAVRASSEALSEVKSLKAYSVESEAVSYTWAKFEAIATGGGGFEWATDSVHTELVDPPMPVCLFKDLSYADLGAGFKPNIALGSPYKSDGETTTKPIPASTQAKVWKEYPYFWEGGGTYGTEVLRYDDLQPVVFVSAGIATVKYRYRISRLVHLPVTYERGAYVGTVTADNATAYPRDGYKDGYWYMRFAAKAEDVSFYHPGFSAKNVQDAIVEVVTTGGTGGGTAMSIIEVEELPPTGISGVMYVVKKSGDSDAAEYLWLDRWEKIGGSGLQADYEQNDQNAADHILRRPFYTGDEAQKVYCNETVAVSDGCGYIVPWPELVAGDSYTVTFDDVVYANVLFDGETLGNRNLWGGYPDYELAMGELPFCIDSTGEVGTNTDGDHRVIIHRREPAVQTIDPKYLPPNYRSCVDIRRLMPSVFRSGENSTMTYRQSEASWDTAVALVQSIADGEAVPYYGENGKHDSHVVSVNRNAYGLSWATYSGRGLGVENNRYLGVTPRSQHTCTMRYDRATQTVTLTHELREDVQWYGRDEVDAMIAALNERIDGLGSAGGASAMRVSGPLLSPGTAVMEGMSLSVDIEEQEEAT